jgi:hypothetical protein
MNGEYVRNRKEMVVAYFMILPLLPPAESGENCENP